MGILFWRFSFFQLLPCSLRRPQKRTQVLVSFSCYEPISAFKHDSFSVLVSFSCYLRKQNEKLRKKNVLVSFSCYTRPRSTTYTCRRCFSFFQLLLWNLGIFGGLHLCFSFFQLLLIEYNDIMSSIFVLVSFSCYNFTNRCSTSTDPLF